SRRVRFERLRGTARMNRVISESLQRSLPARLTRAAEMPWVPSSTPGKAAKLLRVFAGDRGFVELLRMEPGVAMPRHRHTGEVHVVNLAGERRLCGGEIVGPGQYVYEAPGDVDEWTVVGTVPMIAFVVVMGEVEFLGPDDVTCARASGLTQFAEYRRW